MKKKVLIITIIATFMISLTVCGYNKSSNDNKSNSSESIEIDKDTSKDSSKEAQPNSTDNLGETNTENVDNYKGDLLNNIKDKSKSGMVINSEFKAKDGIIDEVNNAYGKEDTSNYIAEAK